MIKGLKQLGMFGIVIALFVIIMIFALWYWQGHYTGTSPLDKTPTSTAPIPQMTNGKYEPLMTITTVGHLYPDIKFKNGEDLQNNVLNKLFEEQLGLRIHYLWVTTGADDVYINKLNTTVASGLTMPDIVTFKGGQNLYPLLRSGKFRDVGELFEQYASPQWKEAMAQQPEAWNRYTINGVKMAIPILDSIMNSNEVLYIRQDWLDRLHLQPPSNLEEMERVMDAFVHNDPDGNGIDDTYGITVSLKNSFTDWMSDAGFIFGAYGDMPDIWNKGLDGQISYGSVQPSIKQGLQTLQRWMSNGYIPKDAEIRDEIQATEPWVEGRAGMIVAPTWASGWPLGDVIRSNPDARFAPLPIPTGPTGLSGTRGTPSEYGAIAINADMTHPELFFAYMNFVYDNFVNPELGSPYQWGIAEEYDYGIRNGKPIFKDNEIIGGIADPQKYLLSLSIPSMPNLLRDTMAKLNRGETATSPFEITNKLIRRPQEYIGWKIVLNNPEVFVTDVFSGAPTPTMEKKGAALNEMLKRQFLKIIYNKAPISSFEPVVARWHSLGGDQITEEVNQWYASLNP